MGKYGHESDEPAEIELPALSNNVYLKLIAGKIFQAYDYRSQQYEEITNALSSLQSRRSFSGGLRDAPNEGKNFADTLEVISPGTWELIKPMVTDAQSFIHRLYKNLYREKYIDSVTSLLDQIGSAEYGYVINQYLSDKLSQKLRKR